MTATKTRKFSAEQVAYLEAVALVDHIAEAVQVAAEAGGTYESNPDLYEAREDAALASLGYEAADRALRTARAALLAWGHGKVKRLPGYCAEVAEVYAKAQTNHSVAMRLIEITMKLKG